MIPMQRVEKELLKLYRLADLGAKTSIPQGSGHLLQSLLGLFLICMKLRNTFLAAFRMNQCAKFKQISTIPRNMFPISKQGIPCGQRVDLVN